MVLELLSTSIPGINLKKNLLLINLKYVSWEVDKFRIDSNLVASCVIHLPLVCPTDVVKGEQTSIANYLLVRGIVMG